MPEGEEIRDRRSTDHHWHFELAFLRCVRVTILSPLTSFCANPLYRSLSLLFTEYFHGQPLPKTPEDVLSLSQALFAEESQPSAYIYKVNLQGKTSSGARDDRAAQPWVASGIVNTLSTTEYVTYVDVLSLFELHNDLLVREANSTTALLQRLFNNYELDVTMPDVVTKEHEQEQIDFLRAVLNTRVMKLTMRFLVKKGKHNWASCFRFYLMYIYNIIVIRTNFNFKFHLSNLTINLIQSDKK